MNAHEELQGIKVRAEEADSKLTFRYATINADTFDTVARSQDDVTKLVAVVEAGWAVADEFVKEGSGSQAYAARCIRSAMIRVLEATK